MDSQIHTPSRRTFLKILLPGAALLLRARSRTKTGGRPRLHIPRRKWRAEEFGPAHHLAG